MAAKDLDVVQGEAFRMAGSGYLEALHPLHLLCTR
jgi:hypothetical protein